MVEASTYQAITLQRYAKAKTRRDKWDGILADGYKYLRTGYNAENGGNQGQQKDVDIYDDTAVKSVKRQKSRMLNQLFPPFREWADFIPNQLVELSEEADKGLNEMLSKAREKFHLAVERSNFHIEITPALKDAFVSTGCMVVNKGNAENPLSFEAIPAAQFVPEEGPDGMIRTVFRPWKVAGRNIKVKWSDAKIPEQILEAIEKDPDGEISLIEAFLYDYETAKTTYEVWLLADGGGGVGEHKMVDRQYNYSPVIAFRMDKDTGEWMGRGPMLDVLGDVKTVNKVVELVLKNASIAVTGIWQADDDGVLNPATVKLVPGTIIPKAVGSGGLQPLKAAADFNVSQLVLEDYRENIRSGIEGAGIPPSDARVRTAFEIDVRQSQSDAVEVPTNLRLMTELVEPITMAILSVLQEPDLAASDFYIDEFRVGDAAIKPVPMSPLVKLQDQADAAQSFQAYMMGAQGFPDLINGAVKRGDLLNDLLEKGGLRPEFLPTQEERIEHEAAVKLKMIELAATQAMEGMQEGGGDVRQV